MPQPPISDDVIAAYQAANYRVDGRGKAIILQVGEYSEPLSQLLAASGHQCAAFVTACNPWGKLQGTDANLAATTHLEDRLRQLPGGEGRVIEGAGYDSRGTWPEEKSFLVLGLDLEAAKALGRAYNQNAILWTGNDAVPRLVLLR